MQYQIIYVIISIHVLLLHSWYISVEIYSEFLDLEQGHFKNKFGMCGELVIIHYFCLP